MRVKSILTTAAVAGLVGGLLPAAAASAAAPDPLFGQHIGAIASGAPTATLPDVGSVRLWDAGVSWRQIQPNSASEWNGDALRNALTNIESAYGSEVEILYVLGNTPQWAAAVKSSPGERYGAGSASHPASDELYLNFVRELIAQHGGSIDAYQIWNEPNLKDFYNGTPAQLATLTAKAGALIHQLDPGAKVVAGSTTVRAKGPVGKWGKAYGAALRKAGAYKHIDVLSAHFYPPSTMGPGERVKYIRTIKKYYRKYGAPKRLQLWDTEMNFGDRRTGFGTVRRVNSGDVAATYVARAYIDARRYGVQRVFWYGWDMHVLGTDMTSISDGSRDAGGKAFLAVSDWLSGKSWRGCKVKSSITTCTVWDGGTKTTIRYAAKKKSFKLPVGTTAIKQLDGTTTPAAADTVITLTSKPILIVGG